MKGTHARGMQAGEQPDGLLRRHRRAGALARYAFSWIAVAAVLVAALGSLIRALDGEEDVPLPPVRATEVNEAATTAGCRLDRALAGQQLNPPVDGPRGTYRVKTGTFDRPLASSILGAAVRQGIVVIHHRPAIGQEVLDDLRKLQRAVPKGTILTVNATLGRSDVVVTAYRRRLECPRYTRPAVDAIRLFRGRFIGTGPDR